MATTPTSKFSWGKPEVGGSIGVWGTELNQLFDDIDGDVQRTIITTTTTPSPLSDNLIWITPYYANNRMYRYDMGASEWQLVGVPEVTGLGSLTDVVSVAPVLSNVLIGNGTDWEGTTPDSGGLVDKTTAQTITERKDFTVVPIFATDPASPLAGANMTYVQTFASGVASSWATLVMSSHISTFAHATFITSQIPTLITSSAISSHIATYIHSTIVHLTIAQTITARKDFTVVPIFSTDPVSPLAGANMSYVQTFASGVASTWSTDIMSSHLDTYAHSVYARMTEAETIYGTWNFSTLPYLASDPTTTTEAVRRSYIDSLGANATLIRGRTIADSPPIDSYVLGWSDTTSAWQPIVQSGGVLHFASLDDVTLTTPATYDIVLYDGSSWVNTQLSVTSKLASLEDVTLATPNTGEVLTYDGASWINTIFVGSFELSGNATYIQSRQVASDAPTDGYLLGWSDTTSKWEPTAPSAGVTQLASLTDIDVSTVASEDILIWNGATWVNTQFSSGAGADATYLRGRTIGNSPPTDNYVLGWTDTTSAWIPIAQSGGSMTFASLEDVSLSATATMDLLLYNGSSWVNTAWSSMIIDCGGA